MKNLVYYKRIKMNMKMFIHYAGKIFFVFAICFHMCQPVAHAQRHSIENLSFEVMDNDVVIIHYDLLAQGRDRRYIVDLALRQQSNRFFNYTPQFVVGDIGKGRHEGTDNTIVWSMKHEVPEGFEPNPFVDDYYFTLEARRRTRAGLLFLLTLLGGASYYYFVEVHQ